MSTESYIREDSSRKQLLEGLNDTPHRAVVVLLHSGPKVWLAVRSEKSKIYPTYYECPAGKVEPAETFLQAARREVYEETGLRYLEAEFTPCGFVRTRYGTGAMNVVCALYMVHTSLTPMNTEPNKRTLWSPWDIRNAMQLQRVTLGTKTLLETLATDLGVRFSTFEKEGRTWKQSR